MHGKANQRRGKSFEIRVADYLDKFTRDEIKIGRIKRESYGEKKHDIDIHIQTKNNAAITYIADAKYTTGYFSAHEKTKLLREAERKYGRCYVILGQCFNKKKLTMTNVTVLKRHQFSKDGEIDYLEFKLSRFAELLDAYVKTNS